MSEETRVAAPLGAAVVMKEPWRRVTSQRAQAWGLTSLLVAL